jgi:alpha-tubulin suppressor-like RCC1 family protein
LLLAPIIFATSIEAAGPTPILTSVSIDSDNVASSGTNEIANVGDIVTLSFSADEAIQTPTVGFTVGGVSALGIANVARSDANWSTIACCQNHTVGLKPDGTLWAWGLNSFGQIGDGTNTDKNTPAQIGSDTNWSTIATGYEHTIALKADGTLWTWGRNHNGRLGDGTTTDRYTPAQIGSDTNWSAISAGLDHTHGLKSDGILWAWGHNSHGRLGDGTTTHRHTPTQTGSDTNWSTIAAGTDHTVALKADGTL